MVIVEKRPRRGPILTPSSLPCLRGIPTINVTEGCAHRCIYCYTQGYSGFPGRNRVVLFDNIPDLVRAELPRKRKRPQRVYFSPSSDAFQPLKDVQDITYKTMEILLSAGVEIAFLTKGAIEERFLSLFAASPTRVFAQMGITTLDQGISRTLESDACTPELRLRNAEWLARIGVAVGARLDPLIPGLTDTAANLTPLLTALRDRGVRRIAASYLFLRPAFAREVSAQLRHLAGSGFSEPAWDSCTPANGVGGARMPSAFLREQGFERLRKLAAQFGIEVHVCSCKNPDLDIARNCRIAGPEPRTPTPLFACDL